MIYLWTVNGSELELNLKELLKYKELTEIYVRDKMNGKLIAKREFKYIDFMSNRESFPIREGLNKIDAHKFAVKHSGLPVDWTTDKLVEDAIFLCNGLNGGIIENLIDSTVAAFRVDANLMTKARKIIQELEDKVTTPDGINEITKITDLIINVASKIPSKINSLLELRADYEKKLNNIGNERRGGGEIPNSYTGAGFEQFSDSGEIERLD